MIRISSESQLLDMFRPIDRDHVQIPSTFKFPFMFKDSMSWVEPSGHRTYLIFEDQKINQPIGIAFERGKVPTEMAATMCQWCHSVRGKGGVTLLTATVDPNRRIGAYLCSHLRCGEHIASSPGVNDVVETLPKEGRAIRLLQRMTEFARRNLF